MSYLWAALVVWFDLVREDLGEVFSTPRIACFPILLVLPL